MDPAIDGAPPAAGLDEAVTHLYDAALQLMQRYGLPFVPLDVVAETLDWDAETMGAVVDVCVQGAPVVLGMLVADWMFDGDRPAYGESGARFIGIRPSPDSQTRSQGEPA